MGVPSGARSCLTYNPDFVNDSILPWPLPLIINAMFGDGFLPVVYVCILVYLTTSHVHVYYHHHTSFVTEPSFPFPICLGGGLDWTGLVMTFLFCFTFFFGHCWHKRYFLIRASRDWVVMSYFFLVFCLLALERHLVYTSNRKIFCLFSIAG